MRIWRLTWPSCGRTVLYIWFTWLTKLLTGEQSWEWAAWFKTYHEARSWEKMPDPFDETRWLVEHTARVALVREEWEADGYRVFTEGQNAFALRGRTATLGGKPDLVAVKDREGVIIDVKTGKPSPSNNAQVMLYMYTVPKALGRHGGIAFTGSVVYPGRSVEIPASVVDEGFVANMGRLVRRLASDQPARLVPSLAKCRHCSITGADCPDRMDGADDAGEGVTEDFKGQLLTFQVRRPTGNHPPTRQPTATPRGTR